VLGVIGERPGVTARELAAASGVTGGTLYSLLRTLTEQGALEKRELPGGQTGYVVAASAAGAQAAAVPAGTTTEAGAAVVVRLQRQLHDAHVDCALASASA
jgi:DNA-binding IclR family transcriptional regulator